MSSTTSSSPSKEILKNKIRSLDDESIERAKVLCNESVDQLKFELLENLNTKDILLYLKGKLPHTVTQKLKNMCDQQGTVQANGQLLEDIFKFDDAFKEFLLVLLKNKQEDLVSRILDQLDPPTYNNYQRYPKQLSRFPITNYPIHHGNIGYNESMISRQQTVDKHMLSSSSYQNYPSGSFSQPSFGQNSCVSNAHSVDRHLNQNIKNFPVQNNQLNVLQLRISSLERENNQLLDEVQQLRPLRNEVEQLRSLRDEIQPLRDELDTYRSISNTSLRGENQEYEAGSFKSEDFENNT